MLKILLILIIAIPIIEIWGLITVGSWIGAWNTIVLVIITSVIGALLAKKEGLQTIRLVQLQLSKGEMPGYALLDGLCILIGGFTLLAPGFFTDIAGFFLLLPYTRNIAKAWLKRWLEKRIREGRFIIIRR